jgi:1-acyl-sn-glycerol-3-phosphate acyltransferase
MTLTHRLLVVFFRALTALLCRIDDAQLARVPDRGPLILVTNHVNLIEIPLLYTRLLPRPVVGLVAAKRWKRRWSRWLLEACGAVALRRGEADIAALRRGLALLQAGHIVVIAPEGTRSKHGRLQRAHPGVVLLALRSGAPLLPLVFYGSENYGRDLLRLRRADFHIVVGEPFYLDAGRDRVTRQVRRLMVDELMYRLAALLPPEYRGVYADLEAVSEVYLRPSRQPKEPTTRDVSSTIKW